MANDNNPEIDKGGGANICLKALGFGNGRGEVCQLNTVQSVPPHTAHPSDYYKDLFSFHIFMYFDDNPKRDFVSIHGVGYFDLI